MLDADREVYEIIRERRDELAAGGAFTIQAPPSTLRQRLLAGEEALGALDLFRCIEVAAENSREYQTRREGLYLAALSLTLERWEFSVKESGTFGAFLARRGGPAADQAGLLSNLGLSRLLGTGMLIVGNIGVDFVRDIGRRDGWDAVSNLSLNITQPLLRGFGRDIVLEPLTQAEQDVLYEARAYERFRRTFVFDVASSFFRILQQSDVLENARQNEKGLVVLYERNQAFAEAGLLNDIEVDQAHQNVLGARSRVIAAERQLRALRDDLKLLLGLPVGEPLDVEAGELLRLESWPALSLDLDAERVVGLALERRLDHLTALDRVRDAERFCKVAADALRAGLDLSVGVSGSSQPGQPLTYRGSNFDLDVALSFDAPFDRLPERNAYRASLIALEGRRRAADESADRIRADLRDSLRRLAAARQTYEIENSAVPLGERREESAKLNLEAGRASTRDVLEATDDLLQARNAAASALTDYILSGLALYRDMELLGFADGKIEIDTEPLLEVETTP